MSKVHKFLMKLALAGVALLLLASAIVSFLAYKESEEVAGCVDGKTGRWYREAPGDTVIVFVHGILGHSNSTWCAKTTADGLQFWPERILKERPDVSVYLAGYDTRFTSSQYNTGFIAKDIWDQLLDTNASDSGKRVIDRKNIIFVMHSMGGNVIRKLLVSRRDEGVLQNKCIGLMFYASPHGGSIYGTILSLLAIVRGHLQAAQLGLFSEDLETLDKQFRELIDKPRGLKLFGREAAEEAFVETLWGFLSLPPVVSTDSALQYFPEDQRLISGSNHFNIVKPTSSDHLAHQHFLQFHDMMVNRPDQRKEIDALLTLASKEGLAGRYAKAEQALERAKLVRANNCLDYRIPTWHAVRGRIALQRDQIDQAAAALRKAFSAEREKDELGHALAKRLLGDILYRKGEIENAENHYVDAQKIFIRHDWRVSAKGRIARIRLAVGKFQPNSDFEKSWTPELAGPWGPPEMAELALIHARHEWYKNKYSKAAGLLKEILLRVSDTDFPEFVAEVRLTLAQVYTSIRSFMEAHEQVTAARSIFDKIESVRGLGTADLTEGKIFLSDGKIDKASQVISSAIERLRGRDDWHLATARERMSGIKIRRSEFDEAEILLDEAGKFFIKLVKEATSSAQVFFRLALVKFAKRDYQDAGKLLDEAIDRYRAQEDNSRGVLRASWARGELAVATGKLDEAKKHLQVAEIAAEAEVADEATPHLQVLRGGIAFLEHDYDSAREHLSRAANTFRLYKDAAKIAESRLKLAIVLVAQGRRAQAEKELDKSREQFNTLDQIFGLARIELVRACLLNEPPTQVSKRLTNARETFHRIGLWRWVDKVDDLIQRSADGNLPECGLGIVTNIG